MQDQGDNDKGRKSSNISETNSSSLSPLPPDFRPTPEMLKAIKFMPKISSETPTEIDLPQEDPLEKVLNGLQKINLKWGMILRGVDTSTVFANVLLSVEIRRLCTLIHHVLHHLSFGKTSLTGILLLNIHRNDQSKWSFQRILSATGDALHILYFPAPWCVRCKPTLDRMELPAVSIDTEDQVWNDCVTEGTLYTESNPYREFREGAQRLVSS